MPYLTTYPQEPKTVIDEAVNAIVADALQEWKPATYEGPYPKTGFGITEVRVKHVRAGTTAIPTSIYWAASITASNAFFDWMNFTMTDMAYVLVTGLFNREANPRVLEFAPTANGEDLPTLALEQMWALDIARCWFEKPFAVRPNNALRIQLQAEDTGIERIGLMGYTVAKRAYLILR